MISLTRKNLLTHLMAATAGLALLAACGPKEQASSTVEKTATQMADIAVSNPLLKEWDTPFGIPPFATFSDEDYLPAYDVAIADLEAEVAVIKANADAPTFANTIEELERAGSTLSRVSGVFFNITNTDTNDRLNEIEVEIRPRLSKVYDEIALNDIIWGRIKTLYETRDTLGLEGDQMRVLELYYRDFVRRGAALDADAKARMKEINAEISTLTTQFGQNLLAETKSFELVVTEKEQLAGLSDAFIAAAKKSAENKSKPNAWVFGLNRSVYEGFMRASENRELREQLFNGYTQRAANGGASDNGDAILKIARLRAEAARIRGYKNHAEFQLETRMAKTPEQAEAFLLKVWRPGLARAKQELADMQALVGDDYSVAAWDWWHLAEKVRQERYAFDDSQLKPYFELSNVQAGAFYMADKLFGISFTELNNTPLWNPGVKVYDLKDADGTHLGIFLTDMFARDSKRGGAWMSSYRSASSLDGVVRPVITNNLNLIKPADGDPALMSFGNVETLFHEFGHGLHGLMTTQKYDRISGVSGPRDYTEFPAQILEHWASQPQMLEQFATHYETGEVIPAALVAKMKNASTFNQGFKTTEYIAASLLDLRWHMLSEAEAAEITDARAFEQKVLAEYGLIDEIEPRYRSPYFSHIFAGGYSAGYYAYLWSEILDADGFAAFEQTGDIFDQTLAKRLRQNVYESGGREEADVLYRRFRGQDPDIGPLLKKRGFEDGS